MQKFDVRTLQDLILTLQDHWTRQGYTITQPLNMKVGTGTSHSVTCPRALGSEPITTVYARSSHRPTDGRYGEDPNRLRYYYQFQVVVESSSDNVQELCLGSLKELGVDPTIHDVHFVEDSWESPILGVWGLGWEVWLSGTEVTQFTYFQQVDGLECKPITGKITYGLERLATYIQGVDSVYDLVWSDGSLDKTTHGSVLHQSRVGQSTYNSEYVDMDFLSTYFERYEKEAQQLLALKNPLLLPVYERILKAAHSFNLLDACKAIPVTEHQHYILRTRTPVTAVTETYYASCKALDFPICNKDK